MRIRRGSGRLILPILILLFGIALCQSAMADATTCTTGALPTGNGGDLIVSTGTCTVNAGIYRYRNVNIIQGGTLLFTDANIHFWAESILVENTGSLIAGSLGSPIGTNGGTVTIHLWGPDQFFNIYDGPSFQDSNAYLDITKTTLAGCNTSDGGYNCASRGWMYGYVTGVPLDPTRPSGLQVYLPNAGIAWKQPNGFYYPPEFHSRNFYFHGVDIRHFVIEPLFQTGTYNTDGDAAKVRYLNNAGGVSGPTGMFYSFTDIDRQTELSDDDGSLTGLLGAPSERSQRYNPAISVNKDQFFAAPVETVECASDIRTLMPQGSSCPYNSSGYPQLCGTANTSPYQYVTAVVYPAPNGTSCSSVPNWSEDCESPACFGVRLYRQDLVPSDGSNQPFIRMAGQDTYQRSSLTVNHGSYYIDTGASLTTQNDWNQFGTPAINVFTAGCDYYTFLLYAQPTTNQTYSLNVGTNFQPASQLWVTRVDKDSVPYQFAPDSSKTISQCPLQPSAQFPWCYTYDSTNGVLSVTMDMNFSEFRQNYAMAKEEHCQPESYCTLNKTTGQCGCNLKLSNNSLRQECENACENWAGKSIDCPWDQNDFSSPTGACYGFGITLPSGFVASDQPAPAATCLTNDPTWDVPFTAASQGLGGSCYYSSLPSASFCNSSKISSHTSTLPR